MDAFEIQVYDASAVAPGAMGFELHSNSFLSGLKTARPPELPENHQAHFTLESFIGIFPWWELGTYLQTAITDDGTLRYAGTKLRSKFVTPLKKRPHGFWDRFRAGINIELGAIPKEFDRERWGIELRPMLAWENERFVFAANPSIGLARSGPGFEPAAMALFKIQGKAALGVEYYGDFDTEQHYLFPVVNVLSIPHFELNLGGGAGLTHSSNRFIAKIILGYVWE